jgi:hypothetical protein
VLGRTATKRSVTGAEFVRRISTRSFAPIQSGRRSTDASRRDWVRVPLGNGVTAVIGDAADVFCSHERRGPAKHLFLAPRRFASSQHVPQIGFTVCVGHEQNLQRSAASGGFGWTPTGILTGVHSHVSRPIPATELFRAEAVTESTARR